MYLDVNKKDNKISKKIKCFIFNASYKITELNEAWTQKALENILPKRIIKNKRQHACAVLISIGPNMAVPIMTNG